MSPKIKITLLLATTALLFSACQGNGGNLYGYEFNTAKITYKISGSSVGSSEVLIKGEKKRIKNTITQTRLDGQTINIDSLLIQDGDRLYTLDAQTKTGSVIKQPFYFELQKLSPEQRKLRMIHDAVRDERDLSELEKNPLKPEKTEEIAGQKCDLYVNQNLQSCLWQGVPLRALASLPDYGIQTETVATNIELNTEISDSEFEVPRDYQITELN